MNLRADNRPVTLRLPFYACAELAPDRLGRDILDAFGPCYGTGRCEIRGQPGAKSPS